MRAPSSHVLPGPALALSVGNAHAPADRLPLLERQGLLTREEGPHGARQRSAYQITDQGEAALTAWLRSTGPATLEFRDEGVLRLFFADALPHHDQLALVQAMRSRVQAAETQIRREILPVAQPLQEQDDMRYPALVAALGADTHQFIASWLIRLEDQLGSAASPQQADQHARSQSDARIS